MRPSFAENLSYCPIHGYIPFTARGVAGVSEQEIIDHPWLQRLRHIHQLQTAWWVYPTAEHTRFQHVLGAMHLASRAIEVLEPSLREVCRQAGEVIPSRGYLESTLRLAGLLHDVGHGPFGHFFDEYYLRDYGQTHETLGAAIIAGELGQLVRGVRSNPYSSLERDEVLEPAQIAWLIQRPRMDDKAERDQPKWLWCLRGLLSGIYTIDNMDFVLRDAYMSGYSSRAFDLERLLHYSFFSASGLTIDDRGMDALIRFMTARSELFRTIYFHRTVRAIDLTLCDVFADSKGLLCFGNPMEHLGEYLRFTESSLLVDVSRWSSGDDPARRELGRRWDQLLRREIPWKMICQRSLVFDEADAERSSIFSDPRFVAQRVREAVSAAEADDVRVDIARHIYRPHTNGPAQHQNFWYDSARDRVMPLSDHQLFQRMPVSHRLCRIYARSTRAADAITRAVDSLMGTVGADDATNM